MEAFSLLKYWRGGGGVFTRDTPSNLRPTDSSSTSSAAATTTIVTTVSPSSSSDSDSDGGDDGPFFDLEFTLPVEEEDDDCDSKDHKDLFPNVVEELENVNDMKTEGELENDEEDQEVGEEIKFTLSSSSSGDSNDSNVTLSPSDDLFFKGRLVPIDPSSMILNASSESLHKFPPVSSILKSATRFRVQMLKFNKPKSNLREKPEKSEPDHENHGRKQSKFFTVKLKVEEVPLVSLFTRDNSSKGTNAKPIKRNVANHDIVVENTTDSSSSSSSADEKKFSKDVMQKYLKKVKPLYIRVSKRYGDKLRFSGQLSFPKSGAGAPSTAEVKMSTAADGGGDGGDEGGEVVGEVVGVSNAVKSGQKQGNLQAGLRVVCKHLGKSRSASSSVVTPPAAAPAVPVVSKRRDDSLLQQQDGIQSAILHCKRSFNASRDLEGSILSRSVSDPSHENR